MLSILEIKRKLPKDFIDKLYETYSPLTVDKILSGMSGKRNTTIRVNTLKTNVQEIMNILKENAIKFDRVSWYKDALILKMLLKNRYKLWKYMKKGMFTFKVYQV